MWYVPLMTPAGLVRDATYVRASSAFEARQAALRLHSARGETVSLEEEVPFAQELSETFVQATRIRETIK